MSSAVPLPLQAGVAAPGDSLLSLALLILSLSFLLNLLHSLLTCLSLVVFTWLRRYDKYHLEAPQTF